MANDLPPATDKFRKNLRDERHTEPPSVFRRILFHRRDLRAGWGLLLFAAVFVGTVMAESRLVDSFRVVRPPHTTYMKPTDLLTPLIGLFAVLLATLITALLGQRRPREYGFRGSPWKAVTFGFATSTIGLGALALTMRAMGLLRSEGSILGALHALKDGLIWFGIFLTAALLEEMLMRGYLQFTLTRGLAFLFRRFLEFDSGVAAGFWTAATLLSGLFTLLYVGNPGQTRAGLACIFVMGLLYSFSLWRTGNLWWALGFHTAWDFSQAFVYGQWSGGLPIRDHLLPWVAQEPVSLSGGHAGFNGSPYVYAVLAAAFASLLLLVKKQQVYPELWALAEEASDHHMNTLPDPDRV